LIGSFGIVYKTILGIPVAKSIHIAPKLQNCYPNNVTTGDWSKRKQESLFSAQSRDDTRERFKVTPPTTKKKNMELPDLLFSS